MAEYIDRAAAAAIANYAADEHPYKERGKPETYCQYNEGWVDACDYIRARLEASPAADVATVVRCKDCVFWEKLPCSPHGACAIVDNTTLGDWYCSCGKQKEETE